ncbi:MAG: OsmC family protein [Actinomycetaceae bacterium]|nr:OsmC family protein [Actinomycetaceae bacterium]
MSEKKTSSSGEKAIWLERTGPGSFVGRTSNGVEVKIGHGEGEFTPGDLLKLAFAGCHATSSDARFAAALGEDYRSTVGVSSKYDKENDRFTHFDVEIVADLSGLSEDEQSQLRRRAEGAIDRNCTISHTLDEGVTHGLQISSEY